MNYCLGCPRVSFHLPHGVVVSCLALMMALALTAISADSVRAEDGVHVVRAGETLGSIAFRYDVSVNELVTVNEISDPNRVTTGHHLLIPGTRAANPYGEVAVGTALPASEGYYTVQVGDSLSVIAQSHDMKLSDLMRLNGIVSADKITVGQTLRVTARATPVVTSSTEATPPAVERIYVVQAGDTLSSIALANDTTTEQILVANGLPNANLVYVGQRLRVPEDAAAPSEEITFAGVPEDGPKRIEIDISDQTLSAWQGDVRIMYTSVSSGREWTPTVLGDYAITRKYRKQDMYGDDYEIPGVPWVMYFFSGYAIHGAYWHTNFGTPSSHGCINMLPEEAELLYAWAPQGTEVTIHE